MSIAHLFAKLKGFVRQNKNFGGQNAPKVHFLDYLMFHVDRARPRPVDDAGRATVGRNTERHEEIYRRSEATMFLTGTMFALSLCST